MLLISVSMHPEEHDVNIKEKVDVILAENRRLLQSLDIEAVQAFVRRILTSRNVFFLAQGRSGFILRCFCMRLMHLGYPVHFCGETVTPAIGRGDLLVVLSGSGETASTLEAVKSAKERDAYTFGVLANLESSLGSLVDDCIHLAGTTKLCLASEPHSVQMAGSLFEQSAFLFLEAVVMSLYEEAIEEIGRVSPRHAVIE